MSTSFDHNTTNFFQEGKVNLRECLQISFDAAKQYDVSKIVVFTGLGEGVRLAHQDFVSQDQYQNIELVAVTFPHGHSHPRDIPPADIAWMSDNHIPLIRAHLPFEPIRAQHRAHGILGQEFGLLGNVLSIFGGGMSLAIQAVLMACDAGVVYMGEHVIAVTADTSIMVRSAPTSHMLTEFIVRQVFCKPVLLDITKKETPPEEEQADSTTMMVAEGSPAAKVIEGTANENTAE